MGAESSTDRCANARGCSSMRGVVVIAIICLTAFSLGAEESFPAPVENLFSALVETESPQDFVVLAAAAGGRNVADFFSKANFADEFLSTPSKNRVIPVEDAAVEETVETGKKKGAKKGKKGKKKAVKHSHIHKAVHALHKAIHSGHAKTAKAAMHKAKHHMLKAIRKGKAHGKKGKARGHKTVHRTVTHGMTDMQKAMAAQKRMSRIVDNFTKNENRANVDEQDIPAEIPQKKRRSMRHDFVQAHAKCRALRATTYTTCAKLMCGYKNPKMCLTKHQHKSCKRAAHERKVKREHREAATKHAARATEMKFKKARELAHKKWLNKHDPKRIKEIKTKHAKAVAAGKEAKKKEKVQKKADEASAKWVRKIAKSTGGSQATVSIDNQKASSTSASSSSSYDPFSNIKKASLVLSQMSENKGTAGILKHLRQAAKKRKAAKKAREAHAKHTAKWEHTKKCKHAVNFAFDQCHRITRETFNECNRLMVAADADFQRSIKKHTKKPHKAHGHHHKLSKNALRGKDETAKAHLHFDNHKLKKTRAHAHDIKHAKAATTAVAHLARHIAKVDHKRAKKDHTHTATVIAHTSSKAAKTATKISHTEKKWAKKANKKVKAATVAVKKDAKNVKKDNHALAKASVKAVKDTTKSVTPLSLYEQQAQLFENTLSEDSFEEEAFHL